MWYGKHAPAPAARVNPLHRSPSAPGHLPSLRFTWAPLEEPARRRKEERRLQAQLRRTDSYTPGTRYSLAGGRGRALLAQLDRVTLPDIGSGRRQFLDDDGRPLSSVSAAAQKRRSTQVQDDDRPYSPGAPRKSLVVPPQAHGDDDRPLSTTSSGKGRASLAERRKSVATPDSQKVRVVPPADDRPVSSDTTSPAGSARSKRGSGAQRRESIKPFKGRNMLAHKLFRAKLATAENAASAASAASAAPTSEDQQDLPSGRLPQTQKLPGAIRAAAAFASVAKNREVCVGRQLAEALLLLDHPYPDLKWLKEIIASQCQGRESLDEGDFTKVVLAFEHRLRTHLAWVFTSTAGEASAVSSAKLPAMLTEAGVPLMPGVTAMLMEEVKPEVDMSGFERVYELMMASAGLTSTECERLQDLFHESENAEGLIDEAALLQALSWHEALTNLAGGRKFLDALVHEAVRRTGDGHICLDLSAWRVGMSMDLGGLKAPKRDTSNGWKHCNGTAYLAAARVLHDAVATGLRALLKKLGVTGLVMGRISTKALVSILEEVGFVSVVPSDIEEFLVKVGCERGTNELNFDQLYAFIFKYCRADGITSDEDVDIVSVFNRFDEDHSGTLEMAELGPVIRWLGYQPTQYRIYNFAEEFGLTERSKVDLFEFRRLVSKYIQMSLAAARKAFVDEEDDGRLVRLPVSEMPHLLVLVGYEATEHEVMQLMMQAGGEEATMDFIEFKKLELIHRKHMRKTMEKNKGVTNAELEKYKKYFAEHDRNRTGRITQKAMRDLLSSIFPDTSLNRDRHVKIGQLVKEADADGNGVFDFDEYIWLMRKVTDEVDTDSLLRGLQLKDKLGYTASEVKEFRDLYMVADEDFSGSIDAEELVALFGNLVPMEGSAKQELMDMFAAVDNGDGQFDFWEFLIFMRNVQDSNWQGINSAGR